MTTETETSLELGDIQAAALMPRPNPYAGAYWALRIDDRHAARELLRRLIPLLDPVSSFDPGRPVSLGVALSFAGLEAIGVPAESLATFPPEFQQGMAARAAEIGDIGENAPENWEAPLGSKDVHLVAAVLAQDTSLMETGVTLAQDAIRDLPGVTPIWQLDVHVPPDGREQFGFRDSISEPAVEGTGILGSNPHEAPLKAGEFVLGYEDENGDLPRYRSRRCWAATARRWPSASCTSAWRPSASTCVRTPRTTPRRPGSRPSSSGAGPAGRHSPCPRTRPTPSATTRSRTATTRGASSARSARTPGG